MERVISLIHIELSKEKLLLEERLQKALNSNDDIAVKIINATEALKGIVLAEESLKKFNQYLSDRSENKEDEKN